MTTRPTDLGGIAEVATILGVKLSTASMMATRRDRNGFPAPVHTIAAGRLYDLRAVRAWAAARRP